MPGVAATFAVYYRAGELHLRTQRTQRTRNGVVRWDGRFFARWKFARRLGSTSLLGR